MSAQVAGAGRGARAVSDLQSRRSASPLVVGVVGARGGAGASSFAAAFTRASRQYGPAVLVQLGGGPSVDSVLGAEGVDGLRWPDLAEARGTVDPEQLAGALRRWRRCAVLTTDDRRPGPPPPEVLSDVLEALLGGHETVVLDLDRAAVLAGRCGPVLAVCGCAILVTPRDIPAVAGARMLARGLSARDIRLGLVTRGPAPGGLGAAEVAHALDLPLWAALGRGRRVARAVDAGAGPEYPWRAARRIARLAGELR